MKHSIALVTGTTSGLGYAAARILGGEGWRESITPLELDLNAPASVQSALAELVELGRPIDFMLLNARMVPGKERVLTAAGVEASEAPLISHHQLTVGLLHSPGN